jgi:glycosyltransferase involved in cell wall biosynthesis
MPCLNQARTLAACLDEARMALGVLAQSHGLTGEIVVADNGSSDDIREIAAQSGARVVVVAERGYGACLRGGLAATRGRFIVVGDVDGSIDFQDAAPMVRRLASGAGLSLAARSGVPARDRMLAAMIGALAGAKVSDPCCSLKAFTRTCLERLDLKSDSRDIATEILIKAGLRREIIAEVGARRPYERGDLAGGWPDSRTHLSYLFILSPSWVFMAPALVGGGVALGILGLAGHEELQGRLAASTFGNYWVILASAMFALSHLSALLGATGHLYGVRQHYRKPSPMVVFLARRVTLETFVVSGLVLFAAGFVVLALVARLWVQRHFGVAYSVYPAVVGTLLLSLGAQTILGGFLLAIVGGNKAEFFETPVEHPSALAVSARRRRTGSTFEPSSDHSFVVPAYKDSPFLGECLRSLRTQSMRSSICISTSTPSAYIARVAREYDVEVMINPRREGIAADWNFAFNAVGARWITLAHQDDVYYPRFLERTLELFDRSRTGSLCFTGYAEIDDEGRPKSSKISKVKHLIQLTALGSEEPIQGWRLRMMLAFGNTLPCSSVTYDRDRLGQFKFSDHYASNLDWDAWLRLATRGDVFLYTHERLIGRRHNPLTETSRLIKDGRRRTEDIDMFRRIWPRPMSDVIAQAYRAGY